MAFIKVFFECNKSFLSFKLDISDHEVVTKTWGIDVYSTCLFSVFMRLDYQNFYFALQSFL